MMKYHQPLFYYAVGLLTFDYYIGCILHNLGISELARNRVSSKTTSQVDVICRVEIHLEYCVRQYACNGNFGETINTVQLATYHVTRLELVRINCRNDWL